MLSLIKDETASLNLLRFIVEIFTPAKVSPEKLVLERVDWSCNIIVFLSFVFILKFKVSVTLGGTKLINLPKYEKRFHPLYTSFSCKVDKLNARKILKLGSK